MKRLVIRAAEAVYNFANPFVDPTWLSWPWYVIAISAAKVCDWLDPVPPRGMGQRPMVTSGGVPEGPTQASQGQSGHN